RDALPSYFSAISFRSQANKVSGVTWLRVVHAIVAQMHELAIYVALPLLPHVKLRPKPLAHEILRYCILLQRVLHGTALVLKEIGEFTALDQERSLHCVIQRGGRCSGVVKISTSFPQS